MASVGRLVVSRLFQNRVGHRALMPGNRAMSAQQSWQQYGVTGKTLPFKLGNRYKLTLYFILYFGTAFNLPFVVLIHQLVKKNA